jgi:hypothetical protein
MPDAARASQGNMQTLASERARGLRRNPRDQRVRQTALALISPAHARRLSTPRLRYAWGGPALLHQRCRQLQQPGDRHRARELERRHRSCVLARAGGPAPSPLSHRRDSPRLSSITLPKRLVYVRTGARAEGRARGSRSRACAFPAAKSPAPRLPRGSAIEARGRARMTSVAGFVLFVGGAHRLVRPFR